MAKPAIAVVAAALLIAASPTSADDGLIQKASVTPKQGFTDSVDGVRIQFRIAGSTPEDVTIEISGSGRTVREIQDPEVKPGVDEAVKWDGLTNDGLLAPDGTYRVTIHLSGGCRRMRAASICTVTSSRCAGHMGPEARSAASTRRVTGAGSTRASTSPVAAGPRSRRR